jgi:tetratricopeptide (TPR) repeat protein
MRRKHPRSAATGKPQAITTVDTARAALQAGRFREAIAAYKALLKVDSSAGLQDALAEAYAGRAGQLQAKGMYKEALVMWENRAVLGGPSPGFGYLICLLRLGRTDRVNALLAQEPLRDDPRALAAVRSHLAAQLLAGAPGLADALPLDDPARAQLPAAEAALDAYCTGHDAALAAALQSVPYRSPYRDIVQILKALGRLTPDARLASGDWCDSAVTEAAGLLDRVGDDSGFAPLRDAARLALLDETTLSTRLRAVSAAGRDLAFALRGWSAERAALWDALLALGDPPKPVELLRLMFRHRRALGEDWTQTRGLRLLPRGKLGSSAWVEASGRPLTRAQLDLLDAWGAEERADPWTVASAWSDYADRLEESDVATPGSDSGLRVALARRRADHVFKVTATARPESDPDSLQAIVVADLEASLGADPDDRDTYLRLIGYFLRGGWLKPARVVLKRAQDRWPREKVVLIAAMDLALASGAYKKAAGIAADVLAVDPINSGVRERLVDAHLAHARKNLRERRPDLATRALAQAETWSRGERLGERLELMGGLAAFLAGAPEGEARLLQLAEGLGNGLAARLLLLLESEGCGIPGTRLLDQLGLAKAPAPDAADLGAFLTRLRAYLDAGVEIPPRILPALSEPLKRAARLPLDRGTLEVVCETLRRTPLHEARQAFAEAGLKRCRAEPIFELHALESRHRGILPWNLPMRDTIRLEKALETARARGDTRLAHRILELLQTAAPPFMSGPRDPFSGLEEVDDAAEVLDDAFDDSGSPMALLDDMIRTLGPQGFRALLETPGSIGQSLRELERALGKAVFNRLVDALGADLDPDDPPFPAPHLFNDGPSPSARQRARAKRKRR